MDDTKLANLNKNWDKIVKDLHADHVLDDLYSHQILNNDELEKIKKKDTRRKQVHSLLKIIRMKGNKAYDALINVLHKDYEWLAKGLQEVTEDGCVSHFLHQDSLQDTVLLGNVPRQPPYYITRTEPVIESFDQQNLTGKWTTVCSPSKIRNPANKIILDDFDRDVLRRTVYETYAVENKVPTTDMLVQKMKEKVNYSGSRETLRKHLRLIGFRYKKCHDKRKLLMERPDIVAWRSRYLRAMKDNDKLEDDKKPVTFLLLDETYIHFRYGVTKCLQTDDHPGVHKSSRSGQRHIIVHAGGSYGFLNDGLLIFESQSKSGDYHDDINHHNFMQWLKTQLIPNLPPNGIVVMGNAPYHSMQINKPPTRSSRKDVIRSWLDANGVSTTADMRKAELVMLLKERPINRTYHVDELLKTHGHRVIRLPPYHCDLNPIENIWGLMKRKVALNNIAQSSDIDQLVRNACAEITVEDWIKQCDHVERLRNMMWEHDELMDVAVESNTFTVNTEDSDEEDELWTSDDD